MGCRRWLGFKGGVGIVGQCGNEGIVRFEKITALEVITGNVNVGSLPTINVGRVEGCAVEKFHLSKGSNSSA